MRMNSDSVMALREFFGVKPEAVFRMDDCGPPYKVRLSIHLITESRWVEAIFCSHGQFWDGSRFIMNGCVDYWRFAGAAPSAE
jgi:hypothetical protein